MLMRTDPFADFEHVLGQLLNPGTRDTRAGIPADAWREGDAVFLALDLPGVDADSIDVDVDRRVLTVTAERKAPYAEGALATERRHGRFVRRFTLGEALDVDAVRAGYEAGVLTLRIPFAERAASRKIAVHTGFGPAATVDAPAAAAVDAGADAGTGGRVPVTAD